MGGTDALSSHLDPPRVCKSFPQLKLTAYTHNRTSQRGPQELKENPSTFLKRFFEAYNMLLKLEDKPQPEVLEEILQKVKVVFCTDGGSGRAKMANSVRGTLLPGTKAPNLKQYL